MTATVLRLAVLGLLATVALGVTPAWADPPKNSSKGIAYRWVDEQGVVHYGDHIPPQYANQERSVLNAQGLEVGHLDAQKTPEQLAADERQRAATMKQKQHDAFLVSTYTSVKDIEALRDVRLDQLRGQRTAAEQYVEGLRVRLATLQTSAFNFSPYSPRADARRMPDDLAENLVRTVNEMRQQSSVLSAESRQETELRAQFQADIERYRELHTIHTQ
ncbi:MAG TPA: DUF4124 domain-containing protein [Steroidobacteraceae bacterium]|jgi:hypothetical protein|nr:DUF4124 domain-containing protein [Steroidobacteraceae bacterium]